MADSLATLSAARGGHKVAAKRPRPPLLLTVAPGPGWRDCCGSARRRGGLHFRRYRIGLRVLDYTQTRHVFEMLIVALGKHVATSAVSDEIDFLGSRRIGRGFERGAARIANGAGRQSVDHVGVVRSRLFFFALRDWMPERPFAADEPVDDGRI